jgi:hypothetical protein
LNDASGSAAKEAPSLLESSTRTSASPAGSPSSKPSSSITGAK